MTDLVSSLDKEIGKLEEKEDLKSLLKNFQEILLWEVEVYDLIYFYLVMFIYELILQLKIARLFNEKLSIFSFITSLKLLI